MLFFMVHKLRRQILLDRKKKKLIETKFVRKRGERVHAEMTTSSKTRQRNRESQYAKAYLTIKFNDVQFYN